MPVSRPRQRVPPRDRRLPGELGTVGTPRGPLPPTTAVPPSSSPLLCRAAGITRRVTNVTSANLATTVMPPGAPRLTASPVPATDPTVTPSRCSPPASGFCHVPGDTNGGSPVPLSPPQGDQELLRGHGRAAHLQRLRPGTQRPPLREVPGGCGVGEWRFLGCNPPPPSPLIHLFCCVVPPPPPAPNFRCSPGYVGDPLRGEPCRGERRGEGTGRCPLWWHWRGGGVGGVLPNRCFVAPLCPAEPGVPGGQCQCDPRGSVGEGCGADGQCRCKVSPVSPTPPHRAWRG